MKYEKRLVTRMIMGVLLLIIPINIFQFILLGPTIHTTNTALNILGYETELIGNMIRIDVYSLKFIPACVATSAYYLLFLLIILTKDINIRKGIKLGAYGMLLIFLMNQIRIDLLAIILIKYGVNWFEKVHLIFWNVVSSVYVAGVWIFLSHKMRIKNIPAYSDIRHLLKNSKFRSLGSFVKKKSNKKKQGK